MHPGMPRNEARATRMRDIVSTAAALLLAVCVVPPAYATGDDVRGVVHLTVPYDIAGLPPGTTSVDLECALAAETEWTERGIRTSIPATWVFKHLADRAMTRRDVVTLVFALRPYRLVPRPTLFRCDLKVTARDGAEVRTFLPYVSEYLVAGNPATGRKIVPAVKHFKPNRVRVEGALTDAAFIADEARPSTETECPCGCGGNPSRGTSACSGGTPARTPSSPKNVGPIVGRNPDGSPTIRHALCRSGPNDSQHLLPRSRSHWPGAVRGHLKTDTRQTARALPASLTPGSQRSGCRRRRR